MRIFCPGLAVTEDTLMAHMMADRKVWLESGRPDELAFARAGWQELLNGPQDPTLGALVAGQLEAFLQRRQV